jgi:NADH-quinone oxidoreductase subunit L
MTMTIPLVILGVLAVIGGYTGWPHPIAHGLHWDWMLAFEHWLEPIFSVSHELRLGGRWGDHATFYEWLGIGLSVAVAGTGIFFAWFAYMRSPGFVQWVYERAQFAYRVLDAKYYVDEAYDFLFVRGSIAVGKAWYAFDRAVVDGIVNAIGFVAESTGNILKNLQSGDMQRYATYIVLAIVLAMLALI